TCEDIYPPPKEIAEALQDAGVPSKSAKGEMKYNYPKLNKLAKKLFKGITTHFQDTGLGQNLARDSAPLLKAIIFCRRQISVTEAHPLFQPYGKDRMVFIIDNCEKTCGLQRPVMHFRTLTEQKKSKTKGFRSGDDGLRLGLCMLLPEYRSAVGLVLSGKKDRKMMDQSCDPSLALFEKIYDEAFMKRDRSFESLSEDYWKEMAELPQDKDRWNPNNPSIFEHKRGGAWLKETWERYLRPRYKAALGKWNKETGGGQGKPANFYRYCGKQCDEWLVWVFIKDMEKNFLLASPTGGQMPAHISVEAGFESESEDDDVRSTSSSSSVSSSGKRRANYNKKMAKRKKANRKETAVKLAAADQQYSKISRMIDVAENLMKSMQSNMVANKTDTVASFVAEVDVCFEKLNNTAHLESMSPDSKESYKRFWNSRRKSYMARVKEADQNGLFGDD
ncbi:unnamed protein product, partial [Cylindrotheca closterium]